MTKPEYHDIAFHGPDPDDWTFEAKSEDRYTGPWLQMQYDPKTKTISLVRNKELKDIEAKFDKHVDALGRCSGRKHE